MLPTRKYFWKILSVLIQAVSNHLADESQTITSLDQSQNSMANAASFLSETKKDVQQ